MDINEELVEHGKKVAIEHSVSKKKNFLNWPVPRMNENYNYIKSVYKDLNDDVQKKGTVPPAAEWLLDNFYIIEDLVKGLRRDINRKNYFKLPKIVMGPLKGHARIYAVAVELVSHTDGQIDEKVLAGYLKGYQSHNILYDREIWALPLVIRLAMLETIRRLCETINKTHTQWHKADQFYEEWMNIERRTSSIAVLSEKRSENSDRVSDLFKEKIMAMNEVDPDFIEHLFYNLRRSGRSYAQILRIMDESLEKQSTNTEEITKKVHRTQSANTVSMGNCITSLHFFSSLDWSDLFETASHVEQILKQDPDGTYPLMDSQTRNQYRSRVEELAFRNGVSELYIAREAIKLSRQAWNDLDVHMRDAEQAPCLTHVGYYLLGKGAENLGSQHEKKQERNHRFLYFGMIILITAILVGSAVTYSILAMPSLAILFSILAVIAVLVPSSEVAVSMVNWIVSKTLKPVSFPRLELKRGVPEKFSTIIAVPTLLPDEKRVRELIGNLESHYLANREDNLYFALIGAFGDADQASREKDKGIIETALTGIKELNKKYASSSQDKFFFFHRESQYNERNDKWIGWERKRGALMEFNDLVLGATDTSFSVMSSQTPPFSHVKYIITLDSDTILPIGMAKKMIGTMAHPLHRPVVDRMRRVVTEGYGLMQPRIEVESDSSNKSLFSKIFTGQEGIDPYASAISDVYQDLFGEGIFTGKGIYDLKVFQSVLKDAIPDDAILSHDLLEGSYVRTGLVTDLKLVDSYPSKYNSYSSRLHRWVRGDWQLSPLLIGKVFDRKKCRIANPLSVLSRWKMFDNLRRSLLAPSLVLLVGLSFSLLPGSIFFWLAYFLAAQAVPFLTAVIGYVFSERFGNDKIKRYMPVIVGLKASLLQMLLTFIFLPYQAWIMIDAVAVTLTRVVITKQNLLEWITSEAVEKHQKNTIASYAFAMKSSFFLTMILLFVMVILRPEAYLICLPFLILWSAGPFIAYWISKDAKDLEHKLTQREQQELSRIGRKTWRYFEEFADRKNHYLAPDNYQADPPRGQAHRTSPTNIGLGLMATLTARDFGYIGTSEMVDRIEKAITTIESMEKWNGHLFNWYDTITLKTLYPAYVSTVDSGNLACHLVTLREGLKEYLHKPLMGQSLKYGLRDTLGCAAKNGYEVYDAILSSGVMPDDDMVDLLQWKTAWDTLAAENEFTALKESVWKGKLIQGIKMHQKELQERIPMLDHLAEMPENLKSNEVSMEIAADIDAMRSSILKNSDLDELAMTQRATSGFVRHLLRKIDEGKTGVDDAGRDWLVALETLLFRSAEQQDYYIQNYMELIRRIDRICDAMHFLPLYDSKKHLFSIGYDREANRLSNSFYDLLASEARQTSYYCIARGEIPVSHWFRMGRALTVVDRYKGLVSWTGTMFEYLMPLLIMKSYKNTLLDETYSFVIKSQKKYGRQRDMPWGVSESGFNAMDKNFDYQYKAIGVPWLGLKRGLVEDAVAAPYASFLALQVDPEGAVRNIERLKAEGLEGAYGFYEAADYTPERLPFETKRAVVKTFMAHHQGMSLMALDNCLNKKAMQRRFHRDPAIHAARLLLQEKVSSTLLFTKGTKEKIIPFKSEVISERDAERRFTRPDPVLAKAHILSNGNYSVMVTDKGTGYSKSKMAAVNRWREDSTLDPFGMFFYLRDTDSNEVWSATYSPLNVMPDKYDVIFAADKATYRRTDGMIETETEVIAASGDNVEIRRISIKNFDDKPRTIEVTSYFEVIMTSLAADIAHPAFSNLFIETGYQADRRCIVANRRPRSETDKSLWLGNATVCDDECVGDIEYETDRMQFIGRGNDLRAPAAMERGRPLTNTVGPVLDPVMSLRIKVLIKPGKTSKIAFVTAIAPTQETLLSIIDSHSGKDVVDSAFRLAHERSLAETKYLNIDVAEMELYQDMISHILFLSPLRKKYLGKIMQNRKGQSSLWKYGISGDKPIVLVSVHDTAEVDILYEALKAHEYWRLIDLAVDLVVLVEEEFNYALPLRSMVSDIILASQTHDILHSPGDVFLLDKSKIEADDVSLLYAVSKFVLTGDRGSMREQVALDEEETLSNVMKYPEDPRRYFHQPVIEQKLKYDNGLGGFDPQSGEYIIQLEARRTTPAPWLNVISNAKFGFTVSESGSGYSWFKNSRENKITPWSNDPVSDSPGEILYLQDGDTGEHWTVSAKPVREEEPYTIRHGFGYSIFEHTSHGIKQRLAQHVPDTEAVKISTLNVKNVSDHERKLTLTYYIRPVLGVSDQFTAMHIKASKSESGMLLLENPYNEEFAGNLCFMDVSLPDRSVTSDRKEFFGDGGESHPACLTRKGLSGMLGTGHDPCGAIQVKVVLEPNESRDIVFLLGMAENQQEAEMMGHRYRNARNANDSLIKTRGVWKNRLAVIQTATPFESADLLLNGWLQYQTISCRLWARSGFYQSGGAYGFRDQLQDSLAIAHSWPELTREQILLHARHQFVEGDAQHWWHEPTGKGTRTRSADDRLWLPYVTAEYIRISGDRDILKEEIPFLQGEQLSEVEDDKYGTPTISDDVASLYEHCARAIEVSLQFGVHELPLIGGGDWNDGMNTVGSKGKGESVWLGWFLISVLEMFEPYAAACGDTQREARYKTIRSELVQAVEASAWDGRWYRRAYFDDGSPLGSSLNKECKIDSLAQSWAVISDAAEPSRAKEALRSMEDYLVNREDGIIKLLAPPFDDGGSEPGYIKGYIPGVRENGGQYTHAAVWAVIAFAKMGDGDKAWELFELINPINHSENQREYFRYKLEPYVMAADVYSVYPHTGRGGWSWYTGASGWMYRAGMEYLLGFQKNGDTVILDPCIPSRWKEYSISYRYRDTEYKILVKNPDGRNKGVRKISVDGKISTGNKFQLVDDNGKHTIEAFM